MIFYCWFKSWFKSIWISDLNQVYLAFVICLILDVIIWSCSINTNLLVKLHFFELCFRSVGCADCELVCCLCHIIWHYSDNSGKRWGLPCMC